MRTLRKMSNVYKCLKLDYFLNVFLLAGCNVSFFFQLVIVRACNTSITLKGNVTEPSCVKYVGKCHFVRLGF